MSGLSSRLSRYRRYLSEGAKERDQIALLLTGQFRAEHQIEELNRIIERQQTPVVQVGRLILDAAQREGLDGSVAGGIHVVDRHRLEEALGLEIVHQVVGIVRRGVAGGPMGPSERKFLGPDPGGGGPGPVRVFATRRVWGPAGSPTPPGY